jgi:biopolymer transport protein ExbD
MARSVSTFSEINITPLTDIFLVLLVIMMVVAPSLNQQNQPVKLPQFKTGDAINPNLLTVEVTKANAYFVQGKPTPQNALATRIQALAGTLPEKKIIIRADKNVKSGAVLTVMEAAANSGFEKLVVAGEALSSSREATLAAQSATKPNHSTALLPIN